MSELRHISFIHLFNSLLSKYYVPGTIPVIETSSEQTRNLILIELIAQGGRQRIK